MNRLMVLLCATFLVLLGCSDSGPDAETQSALVGVWQDVSMDQPLTFRDDGSGRADIREIHHKWVSETEIEIDYSPKAARANLVRYEVEVGADRLVLTWGEGDA